MTGKLFVKFHTEIVNGVCPSCEQLTMLVGITRDFYRCMSCGDDLQQHINGSISYIPHMAKKAKFGISTAPRAKPKKRPGRHKKSPNKHEKRMGKYRRK
jgi:transposase-like protein